MEIVFAVFLALVATDTPAVINPGFEQVDERTGLPQGWHCTFLPNESHLVRYETKVDEGQDSRALLITVANDHPNKKVAYAATQDVPGIAGKTYRLSAKIRTRGLSTLPIACVQCLDSANSKIVAIARSPGRALNADVERWERIETTVSVPDGTATLRLRIGIPSEGNAGGTACIDDIEVVEVR